MSIKRIIQIIINFCITIYLAYLMIGYIISISNDFSFNWVFHQNLFEFIIFILLLIILVMSIYSIVFNFRMIRVKYGNINYKKINAILVNMHILFGLLLLIIGLIILNKQIKIIINVSNLNIPEAPQWYTFWFYIKSSLKFLFPIIYGIFIVFDGIKNKQSINKKLQDI